MDDDLDSCSCDICQPLTTEEKFQRVQAPSERSAAYWRGYAESLEAENYDLLQQMRELEADLSAALARCPHCGRNH